MEFFPGRNSGTVSFIQFKLCAGVEEQSTSQDMIPRTIDLRSRLQGHVSYSNNKCNNSVLGSRINFILGG